MSLVIIMVMNTVIINVHEAKAKLSAYLEAAARGERVLICKRNRPVAELRAIEVARTAPRPVGGVSGVTVPESFFDPLPEEVLGAFYGEPGTAQKASRVAERPRAPYAPSRRRGRGHR
jgi:antitoxin (DNA-binding transcriptional repressor) of toxin-antitoxin stability system